MPTPGPSGVLRGTYSLGDNPERIPPRESPYLSLGVRWARGGGVVLGEEQREKVGREVPGTRTEQRSRGRRARVTAAAETETVEQRRWRRQTRLLAGVLRLLL